jgi:hypothetical protein
MKILSLWRAVPVVLSLMILGSGGWAQAQVNVSLKVDLETKYQNKIYSIVKPLDPYAQVSVNVSLNTIEAVLPGLEGQNVKIASTTSQSELSTDDIQKVQVEIRSRANPFPPEAMKSIEDSFGLPAQKRIITVKAFDAESLKLIADSEKSTSLTQLAKAVDEGNQFWTGLREKFVFFLGGLLAFFFLVGWWKEFSTKKFQEKLFARAEASFSKINAEGSESATRPAAEAAAEAASEKNRNDGRPSENSEQVQSALHALPEKSVLALFSDCYWCREDEYGAFLWRAFSLEQRASILKNWKHGKNYANYLQTIAGEARDLHTHPYYLNPGAFEMTSLEDAEKMVRAGPALWKKLSPLRQERAQLSLKERLKLWGVAEAAAEANPPVSLGKRELAERFDAGQLSDEDELEIYEHPELVPAGVEKEIRSWLWVARMADEKRAELLTAFSARDIAQVWTGSETILNTISKSIPEKKMKLILEIRAQLKPNRKSAVMDRLLAGALPAGSDHDEVKRAA